MQQSRNWQWEILELVRTPVCLPSKSCLTGQAVWAAHSELSWSLARCSRSHLWTLWTNNQQVKLNQMFMCLVRFVYIPLKKIKRSSGMGWSENNRSSSLPSGGSWGALRVCFGCLFVWRCSSHDQLGGDPNTLEALPLLSPTPRRSPIRSSAILGWMFQMAFYKNNFQICFSSPSTVTFTLKMIYSYYNYS